MIVRLDLRTTSTRNSEIISEFFGKEDCERRIISPKSCPPNRLERSRYFSAHCGTVNNSELTANFVPFNPLLAFGTFSIVGGQAAMYALTESMPLVLSTANLDSRSHHPSSTAICFALGSSLVIRKLRICPVASGSDGDLLVAALELPFQCADNMEVSADKSAPAVACRS